MKIEWNKVTWYSKLLAVVVFVATFILAFKLGMAYEAERVGMPWNFGDGYGMMHFRGDNAGNMEWNTNSGTPGGQGTSSAPVVGAGAHCGGNIKDAPVCSAGFHCELKVSMPDVGGTCVAD